MAINRPKNVEHQEPVEVQEVMQNEHSRKCCCNKNNGFEPEMTIYNGSNCDCYAHHEEESCGCNSCCGYCSIPVDNNCNLCEQQMKFVLSQLVTLYEGFTFDVNLGNGVTSRGIPDGLYTECNKGLLVLITQEEPFVQREYVNICEIASIRIFSATYDDTINFLCPPFCQSRCGCEGSIRCRIQEGDVVDIVTGGVDLGGSVVLENKLGLIVLQSGTDIQFVSSCKIQKFSFELLQQ